MRVKTVLMQAGIKLDAALVAVGWLSFLCGTITPDPVAKTILMAIARVLPKTLNVDGVSSNLQTV
jgi:hypothetical protein